MTEITPKTPYEQFKKTYVPLYRFLLIIGMISAFMHLLSLTEIRAIFDNFSNDIMHYSSLAISAIIVPVFMIWSLILLWHKHPTGLKLRLTGYAVSIIASVLNLFTNSQTIENTAQKVIKNLEQSGNSLITPDLAINLIESSFYSAVYVQIGISLLFAWLWIKAWKRQTKVDEKRTATQNK